MRKSALLLLALIVLAGIVILYPHILASASRVAHALQQQVHQNTEHAFFQDGFHTNTAKHSIPLDQILDGGPGKDGIPALLHPAFVSVSDAGQFLSDNSAGLVVTVGTTTRFYPFAILNWHEVVDDTIAGRPLLITFCPLCGSSIVYDRRVDGKERIFGVSGKLYESNLLMYDYETESLWSQVQGEAVVGDEIGKKLEIYPADVLKFSAARKLYPRLEVLSRATGYARAYRLDPYGDYASTSDLIFPVSVQDHRLPAKELMYIVYVDGASVALRLKDLRAARHAEVTVHQKKIVADITEKGLSVHELGQSNIIPGYYAMWFSWAAFHNKDGILWQK